MNFVYIICLIAITFAIGDLALSLFATKRMRKDIQMPVNKSSIFIWLVGMLFLIALLIIIFISAQIDLKALSS